jgi:hypothetical protein
MVLSSTELLECDGSSHKICEVSSQCVSKCCRLSSDKTVDLPCELGDQRIERIVLFDSWKRHR